MARQDLFIDLGLYTSVKDQGEVYLLDCLPHFAFPQNLRLCAFSEKIQVVTFSFQTSSGYSVFNSLSCSIHLNIEFTAKMQQNFRAICTQICIAALISILHFASLAMCRFKYLLHAPVVIAHRFPCNHYIPLGHVRAVAKY